MALVKGGVALIKLFFRSIMIIALSVLLFDCAGNSYKKMSIENPEKLLSIQDSLIIVQGDNEVVLAALAIANNAMAEKFIAQGKFLII